MVPSLLSPEGFVDKSFANLFFRSGAGRVAETPFPCVCSHSGRAFDVCASVLVTKVFSLPFFQKFCSFRFLFESMVHLEFVFK